MYNNTATQNLECSRCGNWTHQGYSVRDQWLRTLTAPAEDLRLLPSTYIWQLTNTYKTSSRGLDLFLDAIATHICTHSSYRQRYSYKLKTKTNLKTRMTSIGVRAFSLMGYAGYL